MAARTAVNMLLAAWVAAVFGPSLASALPMPAAAPQNPHRASLIRSHQSVHKRWDWHSASAESRTEWGIVMRRYYMVDLGLSDLSLQLSQVFPFDPNTGLAAMPDLSSGEVDLDRLQKKAARLSDNLESAKKDLDQSDNTFSDIAVNRGLSPDEQKALRGEHQKQKEMAEDLNTLGEAASADARAVLQGLAELKLHPPPVQHVAAANVTATTNATANATRSGARPAAKPRPAILGLLDKFQADVSSFKARREVLEKAGKASATRLLSIKKAIVKLS